MFFSEIDLAELFAEAAAHAGFDPHIASSADQARISLLEVLPRLVILDLHLGGSSGVDILAFIRAEPRLADTRVIVASADERTLKLVEDEADLTLVKPVTFTTLRDLAARFKPAEVAAA